MKHGFMKTLAAGLLIVLAALFILACNLNHRQYLANVQSIRADYLEMLNREVSDLRERNMAREKQIFALFDQPGLPIDFYLANRLYTTSEGQFFPYGLQDIMPRNTIEPEIARKALALGLELQNSGRQEKALEYLETASRVAAKTQEDLDIRISACMELLKKSEYRNLGTLFSTLYTLFNYPGVKPAEIQVRKYEEVLRKNIQHYEQLKEQNREIWRVAAELSTITSNRPAPFRVAYNDMILSVNVKGQAFLSPIQEINQAASNAMMRISVTPPGPAAVVSRQLHSLPVYAWIPAGDFELRKQSAERAYLLTNLMLGILLAVIAGMGVGIALILKRQHEVTALKSSFVSAISHELRTPMALIRLYAESLASENPLPGKREHYTRAIMAETDRLSSLVNNVLDFARLEKGTLTLTATETDVSKLCSDVLDSFNFRLEKENIKLTRKIEPSLTATIDPLALTQVVFNLVDNAIKYSGDNRAIEIEMLQVDGKIRLRVKDNGIGIPASLKARIFTPFVRGEDSRVTSQRGSGIGLSVVKQLLDLMQSTITVLDNVPAGTVFEVTLPGKRLNTK